jgi:hypothetical protein
MHKSSLNLHTGPYVGGKSRHNILGQGTRYFWLIDPFFGSGAASLDLALKNPAANYWIAETDLMQASLANYFFNNDLENLQRVKKEYMEELEGMASWVMVQEAIQKDQSASLKDPSAKGAVLSLFRGFMMGSLLRTNDSGLVNTKVRARKILGDRRYYQALEIDGSEEGIWGSGVLAAEMSRKLDRWLKQLKATQACMGFRYSPEFRVSAHDVYRDLDQVFEDSLEKIGKGLLILDPPYYSPTATACYPGHKPKECLWHYAQGLEWAKRYDFDIALYGFRSPELETLMEVSGYQWARADGDGLKWAGYGEKSREICALGRLV